ncbi:MAG: type IV secretory system conjugative DNA transfer family protein [Oscillospiraceae bacterium]|nr:type IV secretory system conjugative DNA transfer family protein [Oscillospiraceae bacterium]
MVRDSFRYNIGKAHNLECGILPNGELFSLDSVKTRLNNNMVILGASGAGKTRSVVIPNLLSACGSYIIADPKGNLYTKYGDYMERNGYKVIHLDFIHPEKSDRYNPLNYVRTTDDAMKLASQIVSLGYGGKTASNDPFWEKASELLVSSMIGYFMEGGKDIDRSIHGIADLLAKIDPTVYEECESCEIDKIFEPHAHDYYFRKGEESWAYAQYQKFKSTAPRTFGCVIITLQSMINSFDSLGMRKMTSGDNQIDLKGIGREKTAVFLSISDTDRSKDTIANIFYSQAMNELCSYADEKCEDSRLPVPVRFILDDFGTNCRIHGFENMISNIRSRGISAVLILQSESQLEKGYGESSHTILDNCDTIAYMGGNDIETARMISERSNQPLHKILDMPLSTNWVFRRGSSPKFSKTVDLSDYHVNDRPFSSRFR